MVVIAGIEINSGHADLTPAPPLHNVHIKHTKKIAPFFLDIALVGLKKGTFLFWLKKNTRVRNIFYINTCTHNCKTVVRCDNFIGVFRRFMWNG